MKEKLIIAISCIDSRVSGYIMRSALEYAHEKGDYDYIVITPSSSDKTNHMRLTIKNFNRPFKALNKIINILDGSDGVDGFSNHILTRKLVSILQKYEKKYKKIIFHIHSFHHTSYSMPVLINHIKRKRYKCIYTIYDSWAYTGGCYNHEQHGCNNYLKECSCCEYGYGNVCGDKRKNKNFTHKKYLQKINIKLPVDQLFLVPVSEYCRERLLETPLKRYKMFVINPETTIRPIDNSKRDIRKELNIPTNNKIVVSACAFWSPLKGDYFLYKIAELLPQNYTLLVIGDSFDKKDYSNIVSVKFCDNVRELPLYFQISDVFASVTQGDTFNVTIVEAQVCGVPIVGFGHGGTPETITEKSGIMVGTDNNVDKLVEQIVRVAEEKPFKKEDIIKSGMRFACASSPLKYFDLYESMGK